MFFMPGLTAEQQALLSAARIGVAGLGGLGSNVLHHLVRSGLTKFVGADFDVVSSSNLNRQFYFYDQIGYKKSTALATNLRRIAPDLELEFHDLRLTTDNAPTLFQDCNIVVEAFDDPAAKTMLIAALLPLGKTIVAASGLAGIGRSNAMQLRRAGQRLFIAGDLTSAIAPGHPPWSPRVGIAAALQANTVLALLLNQTI